MTFLPIVERELRVASRRPASYWSRVGSAAGAMLAGCWVFTMMSEAPSATVGKNLFLTISSFVMTYCMMAGVNSTADCISSEKREGTLGLLFLTDLRGYDVVFGKLVATSLRGVYGLMATIPVLAIPILMGGTAQKDLIHIALAMADIFFFSLSMGMFMSCLFTEARSSRAAAVLVLIVLPVCLFILQETVPAIQQHHAVVYLFTLINPWSVPVLAVFSSIGPIVPGRAQSLEWVSPLFMHLVSWVLLMISCRLVPRCWQDKPSKSSPKSNPIRESSYQDSPQSKKVLFRQKLLNINAFYWLASQKRHRVWYCWLILAALFGFWAWGWYENGNEWFAFPGFWITIITLHTVVKFMVAGEAALRLSEDRQIGALELLLSTPLTIGELVHGQILALRRMFLVPLLLILAFDVFYLLGCVRFARGTDLSEIKVNIIFAITSMFFLFADCIAMIYCAIWNAVTCVNQGAAASTAFRNILILPAVAAALLWTAFNIIADAPGGLGWYFPWLTYIGFGLLADIGFGLHSRSCINTKFREVATHRFNQKVSFWRTWFWEARHVP